MTDERGPVEEYPEFDLEESPGRGRLDRREFLKRLGGGIVILVSISDPEFLEAQRRGGYDRGYPADFNAYLRIGEDGRVTCMVGKIEMGQGIITSLGLMLADELDVNPDLVDMIMGDTDLCPWDGGTFGSQSTRIFGPVLRKAAAEARRVLLELAAERLKTPVERLAVKDGEVFDKSRASNRVSYAQLARGRSIARHIEAETAPKDPSELRVVGTPTNRRDSLEKVTGEAKFAGDIRLPDMLYASVLRPRVYGARLRAVDTTAAEKVDGVRLVRDGDLVAAVHADPDMAARAMSRVKAEFDEPEAAVNDRNIYDHLLKAGGERNVVAEGGDIARGEQRAEVTVEETYLNAYVAHAPMETHTAMAEVTADKATVWASTQAPFRLKDQIAETLGMPGEKVRVITPFVGGGFGGKTRGQQAVEAALLSKLTGRPVQVAWSREEEFIEDTFRPAAVVKIRSGASRAGAMEFWDYGVYFAGDRGAAQFYAVPDHRTVSYGGWGGGGPSPHPFGTGAWRAPAANTNTFARESQIDIMAARVGLDPLEFRLKNLKHERIEAVLRAAAEKFGWKAGKAPSGRGFGICCGDYLGTFIAAAAEVEVDKKTGEIVVKRVTAAQDLGLTVNPQGTRLQIEGCVTMGLGYALTEEVHFEGGKVLDVNFDTYQLPRFSWLPKIEAVLVDRRDQRSQGCGEPVITLMGAVIANAVYDAVGARLFRLPMTPERVLAAIG